MPGTGQAARAAGAGSVVPADRPGLTQGQPTGNPTAVPGRCGSVEVVAGARTSAGATTEVGGRGRSGVDVRLPAVHAVTSLGLDADVQVGPSTDPSRPGNSRTLLSA